MLQEHYRKKVVPEMKTKFGYASILEVPRISKVVVNSGIGRIVVSKTGKEQREVIEHIAKHLALICGQKPVETRSKKSLSAFKIRKGLTIGLKATLRRGRMYDFLERLLGVALPRTRDFRGLSLDAVNKEGNLSIGIKESTVFPEILPEELKYPFGLEVTVVVNAKNRDEAIELFRLMGFPLQK